MNRQEKKLKTILPISERWLKLAVVLKKRLKILH